jgi:hypothetical protein
MKCLPAGPLPACRNHLLLACTECNQCAAWRLRDGKNGVSGTGSFGQTGLQETLGPYHMLPMQQSVLDGCSWEQWRGTPSRAGSRRLFGDAQGSCRVIIAVLRLAAAGQPEHEQLACNGSKILPADASAFGFPDQLAGCLGGVPQGSSHKEAILVDNLQLVDEAGKDALIQAVAAYPSMLFVLCCRCQLPGWLAEYGLASRAHDRA